MKRIIHISFCILFVLLLINTTSLLAQTAVCAYCGTPLPNGVHSRTCRYYVAPSSSSGSSTSSSANLGNMVVGALFQNMLKSIFSNNSEATKKAQDAKEREAQLAAQQAAIRAAEQQRIQQAIAQAEYEKMMKSYKLLDGGTQNLKIKTLGSADVQFKTLDGDAESLRANAQKQFDGGLNIPNTGSLMPTNPTPFFGDTMPEADLQTLTDTDNNPDVVDLREATKFVDQKIKSDSLRVVSLLRKYEPESKGAPIIQKPDCIKLGKNLRAYVTQRDQFQKTINLSQSELDVWETANRNALINAAKDGLEYFTGELLDRYKKRGEAAERLKGIYTRNLNKMTGEGIDVTALKAKIDRVSFLATRGKLSDLAANMNDWQTFMKDGMSSLLKQFTDSNQEINEILEDPKLKSYFESEKPELKTLLDISKLAASNKVFGKWVAKKVPMIALVDISIKQIYNGLDFWTSYTRIKEANKINGQVMAAAQGIQRNIDDTYNQLKGCPN